MLLLLLLLLLGYLNNAIWGKVIVSDTGAVVPNSLVRLVDNEGNEIKRYLTKENGKYIFRRIKRGVYQLLVECPLPECRLVEPKPKWIHWQGFQRIKKLLFVETTE
jgi:hypothetical protein